MSAARVVSEGSRDERGRDRGEGEAAVPRDLRARAHATVDRYAMFDLGRAHYLSANARWLLLALSLAADPRTCAASATIWELSAWTGLSRDTVPKLLDVLVKAGLVEITQPFGPNRAGEVEILVWGEIIVERREPPSRIRGSGKRRPIAAQSRTNRGPIADESAIDQGEYSLYRGKEEEGRGADSWTGEELSAEGRGSCPGEGSSGESAGFDFGEANSAVSGSQEDASDTVCVDCNQKGHPSQADPQCEHFEETW